MFTESCFSALKGLNPKSATFRQHYYPEGGWGWVICACAVVVQLLTTGLQFSFGILYLHVLRVYGESGVLATAWPGVLCLATSYGLTPVLCCPLFSFLPLHCAGAGGVLQAKEHQADRRGGRAHHGPRHPLHFICQGASPGDHTLFQNDTNKRPQSNQSVWNRVYKNNFRRYKEKSLSPCCRL